jgi:hypothetical protein
MPTWRNGAKKTQGALVSLSPAVMMGDGLLGLAAGWSFPAQTLPKQTQSQQNAMDIKLGPVTGPTA